MPTTPEPPVLTVYEGLNADLVVEGAAGWDWLADYDQARLVCTELGLSKSTASGAEAGLTDSNRVLTVHVLAADLAAITTPKDAEYQLQGLKGAAWYDVSTKGRLRYRAAG